MVRGHDFQKYVWRENEYQDLLDWRLRVYYRAISVVATDRPNSATMGPPCST